MTFLPTKVSTDSTSGAELQHLPTSDGGLEVISVRFIKPLNAIAEVEAGKVGYFPGRDEN